MLRVIAQARQILLYELILSNYLNIYKSNSI